MRSLVHLYRFLGQYRARAVVALLLLLFMVAADLVIPNLTQRIIDRGIVPHDLGVVITTALCM
ncbi:MAG: hypothetical protein LJE96_13410, partial [Deltaproteobacteria bacterium]|nr:hypothetical protein [Deltaproteobacteria bacterium]